jgi:TonB family protein
MKMKIAAMALTLLLSVPNLWAGEASPAAVKFAVAPQYPVLTLEGRVGGVVTIRVAIDRAGGVLTAKVIGGHPMLTEAALGAARQWKFQESSIGRRVANLKFNFVILPPNSEVKWQTIFLPPTGIEIRQQPAEPEMEDQGGEFAVVEHPISRT